MSPAEESYVLEFAPAGGAETAPPHTKASAFLTEALSAAWRNHRHGGQSFVIKQGPFLIFDEEELVLALARLTELDAGRTERTLSSMAAQVIQETGKGTI